MKLFEFFNKSDLPKEPIVSEEEMQNKRGSAYIVLEIFAAAYTERFKKLGRNAKSIRKSESLAEVTGNDLLKTSNMLLDIHEVLNIKLDYVPGKEYELFPTVEDVLNYLISRFDYNVNVMNPEKLDK